MKRYLLIGLIGLGLSGCATTYQRHGFTGGYSEVQLSDNLYRVTFTGNGYTGASTVKNLFLKRCAELTLEKGYEYFEIVGTDGNTDVGSYKGMDGNFSLVSKHTFSGFIRLVPKDEKTTNSLNARMVFSSL